MLIESKIKRMKNPHQDYDGTKLTMGGTDYFFQETKESDGAHVCDVTNKSHIGRFLSITEGYQIFGEVDPIDAEEDVDVGTGIPDKPDEVPDDSGSGAVDMQVESLNDWDDEKVMEFARTAMGIKEPSDKEELAAYAIQMLSVEVDQEIDPVLIVRGLIEASWKQNG